MKFRILLSTFLVAILILLIGKSKSDEQSEQCKTEIVKLEISGTPMPGMLLTFEVDARNTCGDTIYYKFFYRANYGTTDYLTSDWISMHNDDYVTDKELTYSFNDEGKHIIVVWAFTDPNNIYPESTCGSYVETSRSCALSIDSIDVTGILNEGGTSTIKVNRSNYNCGYKEYYYKYFYRANYGTPQYNSSPWVMMHEDDYVEDSELEYAFPEPGDYIVVVWLLEDPEDIDPRTVPIIGQTVSIYDIFALNIVATLDSIEAEYSITAELPDSGDVYLDIDFYPGFESATFYGTETSNGPDVPFKRFELYWEDEMTVIFDDQERPEQVSIADNTNDANYLTDISYYPDGSYDVKIYIDGHESYNGNSDEIEYKIENGIDIEDNPFLTSGIQGIPSYTETERSAMFDQEHIAKMTRENIITWGKRIAKTIIPDQINYKTPNDEAENHPFIKMLLSNPDLVVQSKNIVVLDKLLNAFKMPDWTCRDKAGSAKEKCVTRIKKANELLGKFGKTYARIAASIIIELSEEFFKLPLAFPAIYKGSGLVRAFDCGECGGFDTFTVTLYEDGKAEILWYFNIVTTGSSCHVEYPGARIKHGTHDKRGHFQISEHNIYGGYTQGMLSGGGTRTGGVCGVTVSFRCSRQ